MGAAQTPALGDGLEGDSGPSTAHLRGEGRGEAARGTLAFPEFTGFLCSPPSRSEPAAGASSVPGSRAQRLNCARRGAQWSRQRVQCLPPETRLHSVLRPTPTARPLLLGHGPQWV